MLLCYVFMFFFENPKQVTIYAFLLCFTRFLEKVICCSNFFACNFLLPNTAHKTVYVAMCPYERRKILLQSFPLLMLALLADCNLLYIYQ